MDVILFTPVPRVSLTRPGSLPSLATSANTVGVTDRHILPVRQSGHCGTIPHPVRRSAGYGSSRRSSSPHTGHTRIDSFDHDATRLAAGPRTSSYTRPNRTTRPQDDRIKFCILNETLASRVGSASVPDPFQTIPSNLDVVSSPQPIGRTNEST